VLRPWSTGVPLLHADRLAVVRIEPVFRQRQPTLAVDLYLAGDDGDTMIPTIFADPAVVIARDRDPLVFPDGTPGDDAFAAALSARVVPLLEALILRAQGSAELVVTLADAPRFAAARAAGCFGAAPLREALARLAPYHYAARFARGRTVRIDAPDAVGGWALLRTIAVVTVAEERREPAAVAWYGAPPASAAADAEIAIVDAHADPGAASCVIRLNASDGIGVVDPLPYDVGISFDPAEGSQRRWFTVEGPPEPIGSALPDLAYVAVGGSAGRIAVIAGRPDALVRPSADTDEARALVTALAAEGFQAALSPDLGALAGADLIHLIGVRDGRRARAVVEAARGAGVPIAVHAYEEAAETGGWWGAAVARYCFEYGSDESELAAFLRMLVQRQVSAGPIVSEAPYAPADAAIEDAAAALRDADVVFAASDAEADAIRGRTGRRGPIAVVPPLAPGESGAPVGAFVGGDPFALVHAPIGPVGNQLLVARAAAEAGIPLVVVGPVEDAGYLERVREFGGRRLVLLAGEPPATAAAGLRAAAAVAIDAAWVGDGGARLAAAALAGAHLVLAERRPFPPGVSNTYRFDPADVTGLSRALGEAWDEALRTPRGTSPETLAALAPALAIRAIVRGYLAAETAVT
jgi:hypothetical protein